jgi:hypothetical protein
VLRDDGVVVMDVAADGHDLTLSDAVPMRRSGMNVPGIAFDAADSRVAYLASTDSGNALVVVSLRDGKTVRHRADAGEYLYAWFDESTLFADADRPQPELSTRPFLVDRESFQHPGSAPPAPGAVRYAEIGDRMKPIHGVLRRVAARMLCRMSDGRLAWLKDSGGIESYLDVHVDSKIHCVHRGSGRVLLCDPRAGGSLVLVGPEGVTTFPFPVIPQSSDEPIVVDATLLRVEGRFSAVCVIDFEAAAIHDFGARMLARWGSAVLYEINGVLWRKNLVSRVSWAIAGDLSGTGPRHVLSRGQFVAVEGHLIDMESGRVLARYRKPLVAIRGDGAVLQAEREVQPLLLVEGPLVWVRP